MAVPRPMSKSDISWLRRWAKNELKGLQHSVVRQARSSHKRWAMGHAKTARSLRQLLDKLDKIEERKRANLS